MTDPKTGKRCTFDDLFYGTSTLGERGQIVIPAEARAQLGMNPGDKILIMRDPHHEGLALFKLDALRHFLDDLAASLQRVDEEGRSQEETEA